MEQYFETQIQKDFGKKTITVVRDFAAPVDEVWKAWTDKDILAEWWAPKPWRAETKKMDFREGGHWLYAMVGPDNTRHWGRADFQKINKPEVFVAKDTFCDEDGVINPELPVTTFTTNFKSVPDATRVTIELSFTSEDHMRKQIEMGFEEGFTMAHGQLDEFLVSQKKAVKH